VIDTVLKAKLIERGIPELDPIITVNGFHALRMLYLTSKLSSKSVQTLYPYSPRREPKNNENSRQR
jgi:hypothetical protein